MQESDDCALLSAYVERGSEAAFTAIVERHVNRVYAVALRHTGNPAHAEEIAQAVFVILAQKAGRVPRKAVLAGWLYKTARLTAVTFVRGEIRRARRQQEAVMQRGSNDEDSAVWSQISPLLDDALAGLGERDRLAVVLRFFYGQNMKEIGAALGASELAARVRLHRALERLRCFFQKRGIFSTAESIAGAISGHSFQALPGGSAKTIATIAVAKGSGAPASTAALVHSASKTMAWTRAKPVAAAGGGILAVAVAALALFDWVGWNRASGPDLSGAWEGRALLEYFGITSVNSAATSHVVLKFTKTKNGYRAFSDWIELGLRDVPMGEVVYKHPSLQLRRTPRETWDLTVNAAGTQMFWQRSRHFIEPSPVMFLRTASPHSIPDRLTPGEFASRAGSDLQGYWKGRIEDQPAMVSIDLKIAQAGDGSFRAEGDCPTEGVYGAPLLVEYERPLLKISDAISHLLIQGTVSSDSTEIIGSVTTGGRSSPARFERADYQAEQDRENERSYVANSPDDLQGHWGGSWTVTIAETKADIRLALDIAKFPDGAYLAELRNVDSLGEDGPIPATQFDYRAPELKLGWARQATAFAGRMEHGKLVGNWRQGGGGFPLVLERLKP